MMDQGLLERINAWQQLLHEAERVRAIVARAPQYALEARYGFEYLDQLQVEYVHITPEEHVALTCSGLVSDGSYQQAKIVVSSETFLTLGQHPLA